MSGKQDVVVTQESTPIRELFSYWINDAFPSVLPEDFGNKRLVVKFFEG